MKIEPQQRVEFFNGRLRYPIWHVGVVLKIHEKIATIRSGGLIRRVQLENIRPFKEATPQKS